MFWKPAESLRVQLLGWLVLPLLIVLGINAVFSYRTAVDTANLAFDRLLLGRVIEFASCCVIDSVTRRYALTDTQWNCIKDLLPGRAGHVGAPSKNNRLFVDAVLYRYRAGIAWRDLPERFGDFRVIHTRHMRWSRSGVWQRVFETLSAKADNEYAMIDATIVRAHQHSAGAKGGFKIMPSDAAVEA